MSYKDSDYTIVIAVVCWHKPRVHDGIIVIAVEEEEHVTLYSTHRESRIFRMYYK